MAFDRRTYDPRRAILAPMRPEPISSPTPGFDPTRLVSTKPSLSQIGMGQNVISVKPGDSIQTAIEQLDKLNGGTLQFMQGTYYINEPLRGYSAITYAGENAANTILDFNSTSANFLVTGTDVYTTGTITSIVFAGGVFTVTGNGTSWLANARAGQYIFLGTRWYLIAAVTADTTLILAEGYADNLTTPGLAYRIATPIRSIIIKNLTLKNSTGSAIDMTDAREVYLENLTLIDNNVGIDFTNVSHIDFDSLVVVSSTSDGAQFTNCGLGTIQGLATTGNGGHGVKIDTCKTMPFLYCSSTGNTTDGYNCTSMTDCILKVEASANGGQGIEYVSGCNNNFTNDCTIVGNTSDGIKLTATDDYNSIGPAVNIVNNGGYGINIAAATCDDNKIIAPYFSGNTSGQYNDSGTGTIIITTNTSTTAIYASDTLKASANVEDSSADLNYTKQKEIQVWANGTIRVKFDLARTVGSTDTAFGKVYINGVAVGTEQTENDSVFVTKTENFSVLSGDLVQGYFKAENGTTAVTWKNFRIYYTAPWDTPVVNLDT